MLDDLQAQLIAENATTKIRILGINAAGLEAGNPTIITSCTIPWLQDTVGADVFGAWGGQQRVTQILDVFNVRQSTWSHLTNPLGAPNDANWNALKAALKALAGE